MLTNYRATLVMTAVFTTAAARDSAVAFLTTQIQNLNTAHPNIITSANMTTDEYEVADGIIGSTKII
jgi:hypothetical protein